ncbi:hypothetical protein [Phreatobacter sp.]|uniref:hypothetical protein n=1 Tax=Phreatobacter sp. TaxID=1966341 RepID=UPI00260E5786|nr:hypothetical protein [Phreatobacter sp.]
MGPAAAAQVGLAAGSGVWPGGREGADRATIETIDVEDMPIAYLPGNALRVRARVVGAIRSEA